MENYDLSTMTRENLLILLSTAKDEMVKYTRCRDDVESCERHIEELNNKIKILKEKSIKTAIVGGIITVPLFAGFLSIALSLIFGIDLKSKINTIFTILYIISGLIVLVLYIFIMNWLYKLDKKKIQIEINTCESQLPDLQKKEEEAFNKFFSVIEPYRFPRKYWYEYALIKMQEYVEDREASNWERVTDLYKRHVHELTMEENARKTFEEAKRQTEVAMETRNAARWAAAGAWTAAAGIWRR